MTCICPPLAASCIGFDFLLSNALGSAPPRKSSRTTLIFPDRQALCNAVRFVFCRIIERKCTFLKTHDPNLLHRQDVHQLLFESVPCSILHYQKTLRIHIPNSVDHFSFDY